MINEDLVARYDPYGPGALGLALLIQQQHPDWTDHQVMMHAREQFPSHFFGWIDEPDDLTNSD